MSGGCAPSAGLASPGSSKFAYENNRGLFIDLSLIHYVSRTASDLIFDYASSFQRELSPEHRAFLDAVSCQELPSLESFVTPLVESANISAATLISALVYIRRLVAHPHETNIGPATSHSIFLGAIVIATKFLDDRPPRNRKWTKYCEIEFGLGLRTYDVNRSELQLLKDLNWNVTLTEKDLCQELDHFEKACSNSESQMGPTRAHSSRTPKAMALASKLLRKCIEPLYANRGETT